MIQIRRADPGHAAVLAELGERTFRDTYSDTNAREDMDAYVAATFTEEALARELADPTMTFLLGFAGEGGATPLAYVKLVRGPAPSCVEGSGAPIEISRFYVAKELHGSGAAHDLMAAALAEARAQGCGRVWLGVWEKNPRARAFYAKHAFVDVGSHEFVLGRDVQTDRVLVRPLG